MVTLRGILPLAHGLLAMALLISGIAERTALEAELEARGRWVVHGVMPVQLQFIYALNFPALLFASPVLLFANDTAFHVAFILCVGGLWYLVGAAIEERKKPRLYRRRAFFAVVLGGALLILGVAVEGIVSGYPAIVRLGAAAWAIALALYSGRRLRPINSPQ